MAGSSVDMKELTDNGLAEAAGLISRREYNLSIVRSRQTAELLVKEYAAEKNIEYTTLADTIEKLFQEGVINRTSRDAFHNIRLYGNKAVHEQDNDPEDAQKAYYLLKNEVRTFASRKTVSVDRTPIRIDSASQARKDYGNVEVNLGSGRSASYDSDGGSAGNVDASLRRSDRRRGGGENRSSGGRSGQKRSDRKPTPGSPAARRAERNRKQAAQSESSGGFNIYDLLRILIPVIIVILLFIIVRSFFPSKKPAETTTAAPVETSIEETIPEETTVPPTTEAETEPPVYEYRIKGNGVNIRFADNQNRVYTQLSNGTAIGTVTEIEGSDFVQFTLDGVSVVVNKNYIEPIQ
jgi:hypothetical protein